MTINFYVAGEPVPQSRPRVSRRGGVYEPARVTQFKSAVRAAATAAMAGAEPITGAVTATLRFFRKFRATARNFGDVDNLSKSVLDAVTGVAFTDDAQITRLIAEKFTDKENPHVEITIEPAAAQ